MGCCGGCGGGSSQPEKDKDAVEKDKVKEKPKS
jgi:hypothetical protein